MAHKQSCSKQIDQEGYPTKDEDLYIMGFEENNLYIFSYTGEVENNL